MSVKVCTGNFLLSTVDGLGFRRNWFPRVLTEAFLESTKDGEIKRAPDPVTMIDGDLTWFNNTDGDQYVVVQIRRAPRSIVAQNPSTVVITDAWTFAVGKSAAADYPSVNQDAFGGRLQIDRPSAAAADLLYARLFMDCDSANSYTHVGVVPAGQQLHFRYLCAVQTPGIWTVPTEFEPRWEAQARWTRLIAIGSPV